VFGDTPAAITLARLADLAGFRTRTVGQSELESLEVPPGEGYAVVATMGHYDEEALEAALSHPDLDVSLIASTRRAGAVRKALHQRGLDEGTVSRVRSPAGAVRGASQEEIAVLALAEVIAIRRMRGPTPVAEQPAVVFATDQVCGMTVDPLTSTHRAVFEDKTYMFCSAGCQAEFEKEPKRYLRAVEA
jgi:xanthine dehydrogenase accessory factor